MVSSMALDQWKVLFIALTASKDTLLWVKRTYTAPKRGNGMQVFPFV